MDNTQNLIRCLHHLFERIERLEANFSNVATLGNLMAATKEAVINGNEEVRKYQQAHQHWIKLCQQNANHIKICQCKIEKSTPKRLRRKTAVAGEKRRRLFNQS